MSAPIPPVRPIALTALAACVWVASAAAPAGARPLEARLLPAPLVTPRENPGLRVRLSATNATRAGARLRAAGGVTLGRSRPVLVGPRPRTAPLRLSAAGRRLLGRCAPARLLLTVGATNGRSSRLIIRTRPDPLRCAPLRWAPPALESPRTIRLSRGFDKVALEPGQDYVLRLPRERKLGGTFVEGGRNVLVKGGHISLPRDTETDQERRALYFKSQTGTVHVEGVLIDGSGSGEGDGIALNAPAATVQIENVRIAGLRGSEGGVHGDLVQPWGGVRELRIDRMSGSSRFQGLQLPMNLGPIGAAQISTANLRALSPTGSAAAVAVAGGGHMIWLTPPGSCTGYPVALEGVWVAARAGRRLKNSVWPAVRDGSGCSGLERDGAVGWPGLPIHGVVRGGVPKGGDFVPGALVGAGYRSPGYLRGEAAERASAAAAASWAGSVFIRTLRGLGCLGSGPDCAP